MFGFLDRVRKRNRRFARNVRVRTGTRLGSGHTRKRKTRMTEQTKRFISVGDVVGLRFECVHDGCGAVLVLPVKPEALRGEALSKCPSCGQSWAVESKSGSKGYDLRPLFKTLIETFKSISEKPADFSFSLEIAPPLTSGSADR